jgi:Uma2 family endonuclease
MTTAQLMTAEELWALPYNGKRRELVRGELREMPPAGSEHGVVAMMLGSALSGFVADRRLGLVFAAETGFRISRNPDTVRAPDVAFVRADRIASSGIPEAFIPGAPDLAAEVISPDDTLYEVEDKVHDWLDAGTRLVWLVNPRNRSVTVHKSGPQVSVLKRDDVLSGEDVVPGFELRVAEMFAAL